jgi:hypothetical protein
MAIKSVLSVTVWECDGCMTEARTEDGTLPTGWSFIRIAIEHGGRPPLPGSGRALTCCPSKACGSKVVSALLGLRGES